MDEQQIKAKYCLSGLHMAGADAVVATLSELEDSVLITTLMS